jgi:hypothetical protein
VQVVAARLGDVGGGEDESQALDSGDRLAAPIGGLAARQRLASGEQHPPRGEMEIAHRADF